MRPHPALIAAAFVLVSAITFAADHLPAAPTRVLPLSDRAFAGHAVNVTAGARSSIVTHSTTQFAAFYDPDGFLVLARRSLGADAWQTRRTAHRVNLTDANAISLAVDGDGFLHVAWNHHNSPLNYARSTAPLSLELAAPSAMTGRRESHVAYPQFHSTVNGDLFFLYRDGGSDNGALSLNRYATASQTWSTVAANLVDGEGQRGPHWDLHVDRHGSLHLAWIWGDSSDGATGPDLAYARSTDGGVTWTTVSGTVLALPITAATADDALRIPTHRDLMNPPSVAADAQGHPFIGSCWSPATDAPPQFQIVHHDGTAWQVIPGPAPSPSLTLTGTGASHPPIPRAALLVDTTWDARALHLIYRENRPDLVGGDRILLATRAGYAPGDWNIRELHSDPVGAWEPSFDPVLWRRLSQAHLLLQNVTASDGDVRPTANSAATPIASLIWAPITDRMRASSSHAAASTPSATTPPPDLERPLDPAAVLALGQRAADWQWAHFPPAETRPPRGWEVAPFYLGVLALDRVSPDRHNRERMLQQAESIAWQPHQRIYHADDHCVIQAYLELYSHYREPRMIAPSKERFDHILAHPTTARFDWGTPNCGDLWSWCDALFMAPVSWLQLWQETGDARYLDFMNRNWWLTTDRLYIPDAGFYLRDESYLDLREPNGRTIHWSRGNGWVFAGLARVLDLFPQDHVDYPRYVKLYREMAVAVLASQQPDGLWRVGLLDPDTHTVPETSGSSFYTFGLAWGVNRGLLDRVATTPAIRRGWNALAASVTAEGKLENVQPIGHAPEGFDPHHTDVFAVGAFLLAASEVAPLGKK